MYDEDVSVQECVVFGHVCALLDCKTKLVQQIMARRHGGLGLYSSGE